MGDGKEAGEDQRASTAGKILALHVADPDLFPGTAYGSLSFQERSLNSSRCGLENPNYHRVRLPNQNPKQRRSCSEYIQSNTTLQKKKKWTFAIWNQISGI